jgi:iron complex transport system substrate-binding protein
MKKNLFVFHLLVGLALLLSACLPTLAPASAPVQVEEATAMVEEPTSEPVVEAAPTAIKLVDGLGRTVILENPAQRIVSIAPSNTELVWAVGALDQLVAREDFANFPEEVLDLPSIGQVYGDLNTELILSFEPDLILTADLQTADQIAQLEGLGLTVYMVPNPRDLEGLYENMRAIAALTGHSDTIEAVIDGLKARVAAVETTLAGIEERPLVFYELDATDPNAPWTAGAGTFVDTLITMAGGTSLGATFSDPWVQVSSEELIAQDPDLILLGDSIFGVTVEDVVVRAGWESISAVVNGQVYPFNDDLVARPGPRMIDGLEELARIIHPDLFE